MKQRLFALAVALTLLLPAARAQVLITEFMASNSKTLADDFGFYEDWIEVHNPGSTNVNLLDWGLTDASGSPFKWRFPATNLPPGGYLVVFASNRDRRTPGATLHTNFKLDASGEYLALVRPDGVLAAQFSPKYPAQVSEVAFGYGASAVSWNSISTNATGRVRVPLDGALGATWTAVGFNDTGWTAATNGIGFETGQNEFGSTYDADVLAEAPLGYWRLNEATTNSTPAANAGTLGTAVNGTFYSGVAAAQAGPRPASYPGFASTNLAVRFNGTSGRIDAPYHASLNPNGPFTVEFWARPTATPGTVACPLSSQRFVNARRDGYLFYQNSSGQWEFRLGNANGYIATAAGSAISLNNWQHIAGVYTGTNAQLYVNGALVATANLSGAFSANNTGPFRLGATGSGTGTLFFTGDLDEVSFINRALSAGELSTRYQIALSGGGSVYNYTSLIKTDLRTAMSGVNASAFLRLPFVVTNLAGISSLKLRVKCDDGFASWINGVPGVTYNSPTELDWNSTATNRQATADALAFRTFDLGSWIPSLVAGTNVLALQALNLAPTNPDLLLLAELELTAAGQYSTEPRYFINPTPGALNSQGTQDLGPLLGVVNHFPSVPGTNQSLTITCRVTQALSPINSVKLNWSVMFNAPQPTTMLDDGLHGDGAAGDGVFGAIITNQVGGVWTYAPGQMVRWFISAQDSQSRTSRWPLFLSPTESAEYLGTVIADPTLGSTLPIFQLFVAPGQLGGIDTETGGRLSLFYDGEFYDNIYLELRGNSTAGYAKKSHRVEFNREHKLRHPGPGGRVRKTSFTADYPDPSYLRQRLSFWLCNQIGAPAPYYYPTRLQMNGAFYQLANHNNVLGDELMDYLGYDPEGALYKATGTVVPGRFSTGGWVKLYPNDVDYSDYSTLANGIAESLSTSQRQTNLFDLLDLPEVINYLVAARIVHENDDVWANMTLYRDTYGTREWRIIPFDMNLSWGAAFVDAEVLKGIQVTNDTLKSFPLYGSSQAVWTPGGNWNRMYDAIFAVPQTREMFLRRLRTVLDTWIQPPGTPATNRLLEPMILGWRDELAGEANRDRAEWGWPGNGGQCNFDPGIDVTNGVSQLLTDFLEKRRQHLYGKHSITNTALPVGIASTQNAGIPLAQSTNVVLAIAGMEVNPVSGNQDEEWVCLTNANAFAVDLSGWQLDGGVRHTFHPGTVIPSLSALYVSPNVAAFRARTTGPRGGQALFVQGNYNGHLNAWGETLTLADDRGRFVSTNTAPGNPSLAQQFLRITEIMYHPAPQPGSATDPQLFEYVELRNISTTTPLSLNGVRLTNGIYFNFTGSAVTSLAPGQRVLVVRDAVAFAARYGAGLPVAGQFTGALDNAGETLRLEDTAGEKILEFAYNDAWYPITDGLGFSLVILSELAPWDTWELKASWRASGQLNGSPNATDPAPAATAPILVNEVLAHTDPPLVDSVELFNPTGTNVSLGGWFLTDDFFTPKKYRIPNGTVITTGSYAVFDTNHFSTGTNGFAFSEYGDQAYLFAADANTNLTGYYHGWSFGASPVNVSLGRYLDSQTNAHFVLQSTDTLGATNSYPRVGPIVISEIMYHPPDLPSGADDADNEFIELANLTTTNVPLYCEFTSEPGYGLAALTNTWRLRNAVDFDFPTNRTLAAGARLLVVGFNPVTNLTQLAAFRTKWNVPTNVAILGPWSGKLDNSTETLELKFPGKPDVTPTNVIVPCHQLEEVSYHDAAPWPAAADGLGSSLQRVSLAAFADDPINWVAAGVTAGRSNIITQPPVVALTAPTNGATFFRASGVSLAATASDPDGSIARVDFYDSTTLLGSAVTAPYVFTWAMPAYGARTLRAAATDNAGATTFSVPVTVTIVSQPPTVSLLAPTNGAVTAAGTAFSLLAAPADGDGLITAVDFYADGLLVATAPAAPWSANWLASTPGWHTVSAVARDDSGMPSAPASATVFVQSVLANPVLIPAGANWRYLDNGTDQGTAWIAPAFADAAWSSNVAKFGFNGSGNSGIATVVSYGPNPGNKYVTYYFRQQFVVSSLTGMTNLLLETQRDDGVAIYLNGADLWRDNLPAGTLSSTLLATNATDNGANWQTATLPATGLVLGTNTLAVEVHQSSVSSSDLVFDLRLSLLGALVGPGITGQPQSQGRATGQTATFSVTAIGTAPLAYQWQRAGANLSGATGTSLVLTNLHLTDAATYTVVVANPAGSLTSAVATLTVTPADTDGDGLPDAWELANGTHPNVPDANLDLDGDGLNNLQEFLAGTSPTNAASVLKLEVAALTASGDAALRFTAMSNHSYSLLSCDALPQAPWAKRADFPSVSSNRLIWLTNTPGPTRFYRVVTPQQP